ncbi:histone acetylation protein-domain-containing protein [Echria macrotheca]|uniref:histone acetyltransferase n=1 Tax=Echria macrotheca TaxID=438768 RepID=A0AAJ0B1W4_9PEZI|nr:histone acetylation protein-domain-containing protein [Echria macrotheca]
MSSASTTNKRDAKPGSTSDNSLLDKLGSVLPSGYKFGIHHLSTPPTKTDALCSAPPNEKPDKTYGESHFLAVSIDPSDGAAGSKRASPGAGDAKEPELRKRVLVFAVEVFIFTTAYQTIFFVSKADSTGYLQLLGLPKGTPSPIREVTTAFLAYLLEHRRRKNVQSVINLFARAQAQYLFPGSSLNQGKHVLDDWGLVRWWCRVLNPLLEDSKMRKLWGDSKGYLIVPGLEETEMRALTPRTTMSAANWSIGHPMERISHYTAEFDWVPPRCLIPRYPDDPKSRFRDELDEEAANWQQDMGSWKSVKTLDQFWEMMAFRQECSSGRLTGFTWLVFDPETRPEVVPLVQAAVETSFSQSSSTPATPPRRRVDISAHTPQSSPLKLAVLSTPSGAPIATPAKGKKKKKILKGTVVARPPKIKTQQRSHIDKRPKTTAYYYWPLEGRGEKIVNESEYKRIVEMLLHLDFSTLEKATTSTRRWISEVATGTKWGQDVVGKRIASLRFGSGGGDALRLRAGPARVDRDDPFVDAKLNSAGGGVNVLGAGLVRKKPKDGEDGNGSQVVNHLGAGLVRKKPKLESVVAEADGPRVNVLGAGLVRKKPKVG